MTRSLSWLAVPVAVLALGATACGSANDSSAPTTTEEATPVEAEQVSAQPTAPEAEATTTTKAEASTTTTTAASGAVVQTPTKYPASCAEVTVKMVEEATGLVDNDWTCAMGMGGRPWIGTAGNSPKDSTGFSIAVNTIMQPAPDGYWEDYDRATCDTPPLPAGLHDICAAS